MPAAVEVETFLSAHDPKTIAEARRLVEERLVRLLLASRDHIEAEVALEQECAVVTLKKAGGKWHGHVEAEAQDLAPVALCAAMMEAEAANESPPEEPAVTRTFRELVEAKLLRPLTETEVQYALKIQSRYDRYVKTGTLFDHDMVRIHPRWPVEGYDALKLWPEPPKDVMEFWNYIASALRERKLPFPSSFDSVTDANATRERLEAWRKSEDIPRWTQRIREFNRTAAPTTREAELRLIVTSSEVRFQTRGQESERWFAPDEAQFRAMLDAHERGALHAPLVSRTIIESVLRSLRADAMPVLRFEDEAVAPWLASLFSQDELRDHLLTLDEIPFERCERPLKWHASEKTAGAKPDVIVLRLCDADGNDAPRPLRLLPGATPLYVSPDTIYKGPPAFLGSTTVPSSIELPWAALAGEEGVAFLGRLGVPLPKSIASLVRREDFRVEVTARCIARVDPGGTEYVALSAEAVSSDGALRQSLRGNHWEILREPPPSDAIICYDRSALESAPEVMSNIAATYDIELDAFRARVTKQFPEKFLNWAKSLPPGVTLNADGRLQSILADPLRATVRFELEETGIDWFDLRLVFDIEGVTLKPAEIRKLIAARGGFVRLADGTWRSVVLELSAEQQQAIEGLGLNADELSDEAHPLHLRQLALEERRGMIPRELMERLRSRLAKLEVQTKPETPPSLKLTLRPYQVEGFHFLVYLTVNRFGGVLADDMGLGKTLQSIAWILWLRSRTNGESRPSEPCLVVCPKSVLDVWAMEFDRAAPELRVQVLREKDALDLPSLRGTTDVLVLNYAQLRGCIEDLQKVNWLVAILDEGQQIKNPDSKVAKAARQLHAQNRLVLTGTPLENKLLDLWSLMTFATPGALGDRAYFQKHFDRRKDDRAAERLASRLKPFIMRRTKSQVARELPSRTEENISCEMSPAQTKLYREHLSQAQQLLLTSAGADLLQKRRFAILQAITRLRQICCHPALVNRDDVHAESAKLNTLLELLDQLHDEGHKVLVFSQFVTMLNIIRDRLVALGRPFHYLTGATRERAQVVDAFQNDPAPAVFLLSLKAGGSGLNLTAASYVVLYDPWWNPAVENQAIDRAHRIGQTQAVMAYRLITANSIEEKIRKLQMQKSLMTTDVLGGESFTSALDQRDLEYLFSSADSDAPEDAEES